MCILRLQFVITQGHSEHTWQDPCMHFTCRYKLLSIAVDPMRRVLSAATNLFIEGEWHAAEDCYKPCVVRPFLSCTL